jgi:magnesium chelatase subunit I
MERARTLGELKASGYQSISVKDEMRANLICKLKRHEKLFPGIVGYDETVCRNSLMRFCHGTI